MLRSDWRANAAAIQVEGGGPGYLEPFSEALLDIAYPEGSTSDAPGSLAEKKPDASTLLR